MRDVAEPVDPATPAASAWPASGAIAGLLLALGAFLAWQYVVPPGFESKFILNPKGFAHFRDALGLPHVTVSLRPYRVGFRASLVLVWIAYFVTVFAGITGATLPRRRTLLFLVSTVSLVAAIAWPPSFSCDVYGYVGYARLKVLHGLNPYATSQQALIDMGDVTGPFLRWNISSPYGPLWTTLCVAVVWLLQGTGLFVQVVAMKLIAAGALVAGAWSGGRLAERIAPGRGGLTLLAIGLNPLFVIEGPGNGHNDLVMMALVVMALGAFFGGRMLPAVLWAGCAGAIKFLPMLLVPWMVLLHWRGNPLSWRRRARDLVVFGLAATLPLALSFWPYWLGAGTMQGLQQRWHSGQSNVETGTDFVAQATMFLVIYVATTLWAVQGQRARVLTAWIVVTSAVYLVTTGIWLPWYLSWMWLASLVAWDRRSVTFSYLAFCFAVVFTLRYSVP